MNTTQIYHVDFKESKQIKSFQYAGGRFQLTSSGVIFVGKDKDGHELPPCWICSALHVVAKTRDAKSGEWGRLLEWIDDDGIKHQWAKQEHLAVAQPGNPGAGLYSFFLQAKKPFLP